MQHSVSFNKELQIIEIVYNGAVKIDDIYELLHNAASLTVENSCFLWLIDYRDAIIDLNSFNMAHLMFAMRQAMEQIGESARFVKRANVLPDMMSDPHLFQAMLKSNLQSKRVKQFTSYNEAFSWLYEIEKNSEMPLPANRKKQQITIQTCISCDITTVWKYWNSEEYITQWFHKSEKWKASSVVHDLKENGIFRYQIETTQGKIAYIFSGKFTHVIQEKLIEYTLDDGRLLKAIFYPYINETIVTETLEADDINIIEHQQKSWQDILDNFKTFVESESVKSKELPT